MPLLMRALCDDILARGLDEVGIFRLAPDQGELMAIRQRIDNGTMSLRRLLVGD